MKPWLAIGSTLLVGASTYAFCPPKTNTTTVVGSTNGVCVAVPGGATLSADEVQFGGQVLTATGGITVVTPHAVSTFGACSGTCPPTPPKVAGFAMRSPQASSLEDKINEKLAKKAAERKARNAAHAEATRARAMAGRARQDALRARAEAEHAAGRAHQNAQRAKVEADRAALRARAGSLVTAVQGARLDAVKVAQVADQKAALEAQAEALKAQSQAFADAREALGESLAGLGVAADGEAMAADVAALDEARVLFGQQLTELGSLVGDLEYAEDEAACDDACEDACDEACAEDCEDACDDACAEACEDACDAVTVVEGVNLFEEPAAIAVQGDDVTVLGVDGAEKAKVRVKGMKLPTKLAALSSIGPGVYKVAVGQGMGGPSRAPEGSANGDHEAILHQLQVLTEEIRALREEVRAMHASSRITETY